MKLTIRDKILLHLYRCKFLGGPSEEQTRRGITKACNDFVESELSSLRRADFIDGKRVAVHGSSERQLIAYSLTRQGEFAAEELIREIVALHNKVLPLIKTEVR